jgi:hypothetical protein
MAISGFGWDKISVSPGQIFLFGTIFFMPTLSPSFFGWLNGLLAVPVFYLLAINGYNVGKKQIASSLLIAGFGALLVQQVEIFLFSLTLIPLGFTLFKSGSIRESAGISGGKGLLALGLTWLLFGGVLGVIVGVNPYNHLLKILDLGFQQTLELYSAKDAGLSPEILFSLNQLTNVIRETIPKLLPGLLMSVVAMTVWINMILVNSLTGNLANAAPCWGRYATWRLPEKLVWVPIVAILLVLLGRNTVQDAGGSLLLISSLVYFFQGLAVFISLLDRWRLPLFIRLMLYFFFIIQSYSFVIFAILGISDVWVNLRTDTEQQ